MLEILPRFSRYIFFVGQVPRVSKTYSRRNSMHATLTKLTDWFQVENRRLERVLRPREDELLADGPKEKRNESALLIDRFAAIFERVINVIRYRFLDLFPCTREELRSMGYKDAGSLMSELIVSDFFFILNRGDSCSTFSLLRRRRQKLRIKF